MASTWQALSLLHNAVAIAALTLLTTLAPVLALAQQNSLETLLVEQESSLSARLGLAVLDLQTGQRFEYRAHERFPLSSTFKTLACAALLQRVDAGRDQLSRRLIISESELVNYSPATESRTGESGISLAELCQATLTLSDNTAGNKVLQAIGGPTGLTSFLRTIGDRITRLDRWETALNEALPGDPRDTTSPAAMVDTLEMLFFSDVLSPASRAQLENWLQGNQVGDALFRAAIPADWHIADKTGAGGYGSRSIAAVLRPPGRAPVIAALYLTETEASFDERNSAIARIGQAIVAWLSN